MEGMLNQNLRTFSMSRNIIKNCLSRRVGTEETECRTYGSVAVNLDKEKEHQHH